MDSIHLLTLGYPDGWIGEMFKYPDSLFNGNTKRHQSCAGKKFTFNNLKDELKGILRIEPDEEVYTTHIRDSHDDHSCLARILQKAREELVAENILFPVFWSVIHEPGGDNNGWPTPTGNDQFEKGKMMKNREDRYTPWEVLHQPLSMKEPCLNYFINESLWKEENGHRSIMRQALDQFETGIGTMKSDGTSLMPGYEGWMDRNGYFLSFLKRNHLFWLAPFPSISRPFGGPCKNGLSVYPPNKEIMGIEASGMEGKCSCQSEIFGGEGIKIGSGLESGRVWLDFGPVFQDTVTLYIQWVDNSWKSDKKLIEIYNWKSSLWETVTLFEGNMNKMNAGRVNIQIKNEYKGVLHKIRIGIKAERNAIIHVKGITIETIEF